MRKIELLFLLLLFCLHSNVVAADQDSLIIRFFSWEMESPHNITCLNFENKVPFREYIITSPVVIDSMSDQLQKLQKCKDKDFQVGCKLYFIKCGKVNRVFCMNSNSVFSNNIFYKNNKDVIKKINRLIAIYPKAENDCNFSPKQFGDEFAQGRDSLFRVLQTSMAETIKNLNYNDTLIVSIYCKAYKNGKTKSAVINPANKKSLSDIEKKIIMKLRDVLMTKITWRKNSEHMDSDDIIFPYVIR